MLYVVSYDITNDRRRAKIARLLEGFGQRVQYSVFECELTDAHYQVLKKKYLRILKVDEGDSVRVYRLCKTCVQAAEVQGDGPPFETSLDVYVV